MIDRTDRRKDRALIVIVAAFSLVLLVVSLLLLQNARRMSRLLIEYDASRLAAVMLEEFVESSELYFEELSDRVLGAGIYDGRGRLLDGRGRLPDTVPQPSSRVDGGLFDFDQSARTVTFIRPIEIQTLVDDRFGRRDPPRTPDRRPAREQRYSFALRADASSYYRLQSWYSAGLIVAPVVIIALGVAAVRALLRSRRREEELAGREELARLGESARTLAHEIKNPLNAIRIRTRLLRDVVPDGEDVEAIDAEVDRLRRLSDRVGDFLRDAVGAPEPIRIAAAVQETANRNAWPVSLEIDEGAANAVVMFDRVRLESVLGNVLANAAEAQPEGSNIRVVLSAARKGFITLQINDSGPGLPPDVLGRAFDPFFTTKAQGSGVGLAIVKRFVDASDGSVTIDSGPEGTTVTITLPEADHEHSDR